MNIFNSLMVASVTLASVVVLNVSTAHAQSVEYIIFSVSGSAEGSDERFVLGAVLKEGDEINLPENSEVKLLDKSGSVIVLKGPVSGTVTNDDGGTQQAKDGSNALQVISKLMFGENRLVNNLGAARSVRTTKPEPENVQPWMPIISMPGTYCLPSETPVFGREEADAEIVITVSSSDGAAMEKVWTVNEKSISVSDLVQKDTDHYTLILSSQDTESSIHLLDRTDMNATQQIAWMAERGCQIQAMQLLNEMSSGVR
ncbi:MAG: hypothetical protein JKX91_05865 [Rhizobiaceae bacterium]|nr:hypothetical protein [Rhizobiaceae bacterium]